MIIKDWAFRLQKRLACLSVTHWKCKKISFFWQYPSPHINQKLFYWLSDGVYIIYSFQVGWVLQTLKVDDQKRKNNWLKNRTAMFSHRIQKMHFLTEKCFCDWQLESVLSLSVINSTRVNLLYYSFLKAQSCMVLCIIDCTSISAHHPVKAPYLGVQGTRFIF
jgi:hypothetical protein